MTVLLHVCGGVPQGSALVPLLLCQQFASDLTDPLQGGLRQNRNDLCQQFYGVWLLLPGGTAGLQYGPVVVTMFTHIEQESQAWCIRSTLGCYGTNVCRVC